MVKVTIKNKLNIFIYLFIFWQQRQNVMRAWKSKRKGGHRGVQKKITKEQRHSLSQTANAKQDMFRVEILEFLRLRELFPKSDYVVTLVSINRHNSIPATDAKLLIEVLTNGFYIVEVKHLTREKQKENSLTQGWGQMRIALLTYLSFYQKLYKGKQQKHAVPYSKKQ